MPPATPVIQRSATAHPAAATPVPSGTCSPATVTCDSSWPVVSTRRPSVARALARCPRPSAASVSSTTPRAWWSVVVTRNACVAVSPPGSCAVTVTVAVPRRVAVSVNVAPVRLTATA